VIADSRKFILNDEFIQAQASGWLLKSNLKKCMPAFPLSSHADFNQLVKLLKNFIT